MKILNLYSGIGGNRKLWPQGSEVTAVEINPEIAEVYADQFPDDEIVIGDAHKYLAKNYEGYDFIWSSPPCQSHSRMIVSGQNRTPQYPDLKLYEEILFLQQHCKTKWVVENVVPYYEPLIVGSRRGRHMFWSNFHIPHFAINEPGDFINTSKKGGKERLMKWLGIHFKQNIYYENSHCPAQILRNAVHPDIGLAIYNAMAEIQSTAKGTQKELFA